MKMPNFSLNNLGQASLATTLIALAVFASALLSFNWSLDKARKQVKLSGENLTAQGFLTELAEYFRAIPTSSLEAYLMTNPVTGSNAPGSRYSYCTPINYLDRSTQTYSNPDPLSALPDNSLDRSSVEACKSNRWYKVEVVDRATQNQDLSFCSTRFGEKQLTDSQTYLVTVGISYLPQGSICSGQTSPNSFKQSVTSILMLPDRYCDYEQDPTQCLGTEPSAPVPWSPTACVIRAQGPLDKKNPSAPNYSRCPEHYGVFVTGNGDDYGAVCCPLPSQDILTGSISVKKDKCGTNEIGIGVYDVEDDYTEIYCQSINTAKYKLEKTQEACVWSKSGTHGWGTATKCTNEPPVIGGILLGTSTVMTVGTDGCSGNPYGSLWVQRDSKDCSDQGYSRLLHLDGTAVIMHAP